MQDQKRRAFSKDKEIIPFIAKHWEQLTVLPRRTKTTWHNTVAKTMQKYNETFICDNRDPDDMIFALRSTELEKIAPNFDYLKNNGQGNGTGAPAVTYHRPLRGAKKKFNMQDWSTGDVLYPNKRQKSELSQPKLPPSGFPPDYPFNKDGYRYILAEPDPHAPCRKEFEETLEYPGKRIPPWLCRKLVFDRVLLSMNDRASQLKISEDRLSITGEKGYCMVRANHGVSRGVWYYEIKITEMPDNSATRIGWAQELADLQTPLGYDKFGYAWRSRKGTKFHQSIGWCYDCLGLNLRPKPFSLP